MRPGGNRERDSPTTQADYTTSATLAPHAVRCLAQRENAQPTKHWGCRDAGAVIKCARRLSPHRSYFLMIARPSPRPTPLPHSHALRGRAICLCRQSCRSPTYSSMYPLVRSPVRGCPLHQVRGLSSHVVHQSPSWADRDGVVRQNHAAYSPELSCFVHGRKGDRGDYWQAAALQGLSLPPCDSSVHDPRRE